MRTVASLLIAVAFASSAHGAVDALALARGLAHGEFAGFVYGSKGPKKIDCVQFLWAVVEKMAAKRKIRLSAKTKRTLMIAHLTPAEIKRLQQLVERSDPKIRGVQTALLEAKLGKAISPKDARAGDLLQYWYPSRGKWAGHAGIVEKVERGVATIYGSHKTTLQRERGKKPADKKGGIGSGPQFDLTNAKRKVFVVRWTK